MMRALVVALVLLSTATAEARLRTFFVPVRVDARLGREEPVIVLYSVSGQSLSIGTQGTPALSTTQPFTNRLWNNTALINMVESGNESHMSAFANSIAQFAPGVSVVQDNWGVGGAAILTLTTTYYAPAITEFGEMVAAVQAANPGVRVVIGGLIWIQGETDNQNVSMTEATYATRLDALQSAFELDMRTNFPALVLDRPGVPSVPLYITQLGAWNHVNSGEWYWRADKVVTAQYRSIARNPKIIVTASPYFLSYASDQIHLANVSYRTLGAYLAKYARLWLDGEPANGLRPDASAIACSGNVISVPFVGGADGACLTLDTTSIARRPDHGFAYWEDTMQTDLPVVTGVSVAACRRVEVTLNRNCTASGRVRCGWHAIPTAGAGAMAQGGPGCNVRTLGRTRGWDGAEPWPMLPDWPLIFDEPLGSCSGCTASPVSSYSTATWFVSDDSPASWLSAGYVSELAATAFTVAIWVEGALPASDAVIWAQTMSNFRGPELRVLADGALRVFVPSSTTDTTTYWTSAAGAMTTAKTLVVVAFSGAGTGDDGRLDVWTCTDGTCTERSTAGTFAGTMPSTTRAGYADFAVGGQSTALGLHTVERLNQHVSIWTVAFNDTNVAALYNAGAGTDARLHSRGAPAHHWPLQGNGEDVGTGSPRPFRVYGVAPVWVAL